MQYILMVRRGFQIGAVICATLVIGCSPFRLYYQPGVAVEAMQRDQLACETRALAAAPVANQIRQSPPRYVPARRYCRAPGDCYSRGGYFVGGDIYTVDVNADLRRRVERQCMADQGYAFTELPRCRTGIADQVPVAATQVLPPLTDQSCVISNEDGTWQIVTVAG